MRPALAPAVPLVALLAGCPEYELTEYETTDIFNQNPWEKVDVLLVIDNSCSMEPYQEKLATDFGGFFDFFEIGEVDWRIAVVTTDVLANDFGRIRGPIITAEADDPEAQFADIVHVGTTGAGIEMGLEAASRALNGYNPGFPREDASISVIFVSDEQDASPDAVSAYADAYYAVRGARSRDAFNASALTVSEPADCTPEQYAASSPGTRYVEAARLTGGIVANLCTADFAHIVQDLALTTSAMRDTFFLSHFPRADTLQVSLEESELPCDEGVWTYQLVEDEGHDRPAIVFAPEHIPAPDARVVVKYKHGNGDPTLFCTATDEETAGDAG